MYKIKPVFIKIKCSKCKEGYMKKDGYDEYIDNPPHCRFKYKCDKCGYVKQYSEAINMSEFIDTKTGKCML